MKNLLRSFLLLILVIDASCSKAADPKDREKELSYLRCIMPENLLEFSNVEVSALENITIIGEGKDQHIGLHLFPGQNKKNGGVRAEISINYPFKAGDTLRYAWRFMVPEGFQSDAPRNRWWLIGQWHDQPNKDRGESWVGFPSNSPPVLLALGELKGRLGTALSYNPRQSQRSAPVFITPGKWHSITLEIHWSQQADGKATFFFDDMTQPAIVLDGPNMHNDFQHYLKIGMYRHPDITTANSIFIDDISITFKEAS